MAETELKTQRTQKYKKIISKHKIAPPLKKWYFFSFEIFEIQYFNFSHLNGLEDKQKAAK